MTVGENDGRAGGVDPRVDRRRHHDHRAHPPRSAARNGAMSGEVRVVTVSLTPAVVSVLAATCPSPGKCLAVIASPADRMPRRKADALVGHHRRRVAVLAAVVADRRVARCPRGRCPSRARGWCRPPPARPADPSAARSTSASRRPTCPAPARSAAARTRGPCSTWTAPPSWSAAMNSGTPAVAALGRQRVHPGGDGAHGVRPRPSCAR